jgi:alpha-glucosidase
VYLPKGEWFDYYQGDYFESFGSYVQDIKVKDQEHFRLPLFVKAGAIIPTMYVDQFTQNISGKRKNNGVRRL